MRLLYILSVLLFATFSIAQDDFNLELISQTTYPEGGNDIWGYVSDDGTEYAIVGTVDNTRIYDLSDPTAPREVIAIQGDNTVWRDMKSWEDHVYVTADAASDGLLVIDMSEAATDSIRFQFLNPTIPNTTGGQSLESCHNIYIDENGYAYLAGCGGQNSDINKAVIFDLNADKWNPPLVGVHGGGASGYAHDLYVRDNIMYSSEIYDGTMEIYDVTDKSEILLLGEAPTSFDFTHNIWISDDSNYAFTTDERGNAFVDAYDISDFTDIRRLDMFQPMATRGEGVVPHNTHYHNGFLVTSWYTEGVVVTDVSRPDNMIKVGAYDTFDGPNGGTQGCWGAFPYLPSGVVLANDRVNGLHVLQPNYQRACYLEGTVTDRADGALLSGVSVEIVTDELNEGMTDIRGEYKTGLATAGTYQVVFSVSGYQDKTVDAVLENGVLTILDVEMERPPVTVTGTFVDAETGELIPNGVLRAITDDDILDIEGGSDGQFLFYTYDKSHDIIAAAWGYEYRELTYVPAGEDYVIELTRGYMDDFALDLGWEVRGDATAGIWERGVPVGTFFRSMGMDILSNIDFDDPLDIGEECYVTGNGGGEAREDDVDGGSTILSSPEMDLSSYVIPEIQFRTYFFNEGGNTTPDDKLDITLYDGSSFYFYGDFPDNTDTWTDVINVRPQDLGIDLADPITINFAASDLPGNGHLVESALDVFRVVEAGPSSTEEITGSLLVKVYPNPATDFIQIESFIDDIQNVSIYDVDGVLVHKSAFMDRIPVTNYQSGTYLMEIERLSGDRLTTRIIIK